MRTVSIGLVVLVAAGAAAGQIGGSRGGNTGNAGRVGTSSNPNSTGLGDASPNQRPIYVSGKVALSDGAALPEPVKIERVCASAVRTAAHTDFKGGFSFELGSTVEIGDASDQANAAGGLRTPRSGTPNRSLTDCELRFSLPGFRTETVSLSGERYLDNPDLGTILLRRIANVEGLTVSATSSLAPKDAKKAYEKGTELAAKKKVDEAQKDFARAVELYPRYAAAWFELGRINEGLNHFEDARKSYQQAVVADAKFIPPHERLAWIALRETKWQEVADQSDNVLRLDPIDYPDAYYLNGVGNLQLGNFDAAEKSAREAVTRDKTRRNVRATYVLGLILAQKRDFAGAASLLRTFLAQNPDVADAVNIQQQLAAIEEAAKAQSGAATP